MQALWLSIENTLRRKALCCNPTLAKCRGEAQHSQSWGLRILRDSQMFRVRQQGPKHLALRCSWCHWKGLEVQMSKMPSHWPFGHRQPKLWAKEGRESNRQFDSRPLKVKNRPLSDLRIESAIRPWKDLDEGYNFGKTSLRLDFAIGSYELPKFWNFTRDNFRIISGLQLGSPGKKSHLDVASMERCRE